MDFKSRTPWNPGQDPETKDCPGKSRTDDHLKFKTQDCHEICPLLQLKLQDATLSQGQPRDAPYITSVLTPILWSTFAKVIVKIKVAPFFMAQSVSINWTVFLHKSQKYLTRVLLYVSNCFKSFLMQARLLSGMRMVVSVAHWWVWDLIIAKCHKLLL